MKNTLRSLFLILLLTRMLGLFGQLSSYELTATSGSFVPNSSSAISVSSIQAGDSMSSGIPIGFAFTLDSIQYTHIKASSNGWITFDTTNNPSNLISQNNDLSHGVGLRPLIAPLWDNLNGASGTASYEVTGVTPNRVFTFEWENWKWDAGASSAVISFQTKLFESSNQIQFIYKRETGSVSINNGGASIGFAAVDTGLGNFLSLNNVGNSPSISSLSETNNIGLKPATGQIYSFKKKTWDLELVSFVSPNDSCSNSASNITVAIRNNSGKKIKFSSDSCLVSVATSGSVTANYSKVLKSDSLNSMDTMHINLVGNYNKSIIGVHNFLASVTVVNDTAPNNDTLALKMSIDTATSAQLVPVPGLCLNSGSTTLVGSGNPIGGTGVYSGVGVTGTIFNPAVSGVGGHQVKYVYTDVHGCSDSTSISIQVDSVPKVRIGSFSSICKGATPIALKSGTPSGGTYFGKNVGLNLYVPFTAGIDTIFYSYTDGNNCSDTAYNAIVVDTIPKVTFSSISRVCVNSGAFALIGGMPTGGVYSGNNVNVGMYTPDSSGIDTLQYAYTDLNSCKDSATSVLIVDSVPKVTLNFPISQTCTNSGKTPVGGGFPSGGLYKGDKIVGSDFDPSIGTPDSSLVYYVFTDGFNCTDSVSTLVVVDTMPKAFLASLGTMCKLDNVKLLTGGSPAGGVYSGTHVNSTTSEFDPSNATTGTQAIFYSVTTPKGCVDSVRGDLIVEANPIFGFGNDTAICGTAVLTLDVGLTSMKYLWSTGDSTQSIQVQNSVIIVAEVIDTSTMANCSYSDTIRVDYDAICVGLNEISTGASARFYPNPSSGIFYIELEDIGLTQMRVQVFSMEGKEVYRNEIILVGGNFQGTIDLSAQPSGIYMINLYSEKGMLSKRISIK